MLDIRVSFHHFFSFDLDQFSFTVIMCNFIALLVAAICIGFLTWGAWETLDGGVQAGEEARVEIYTSITIASIFILILAMIAMFVDCCSFSFGGYGDVRKPRFNTKEKSWNCYQWMIAYLFFFHVVHWSFILGQGWLLSSNHFCKACQNCLRPSFVIVHKAGADAFIVALLWKLPQIPICSTNYATLDKNNFDVLYKFIVVQPSGQIWTNNIPNKSRIILLSYTELNFIISVFGFIEIWSQTQVFFLCFVFYSHCITTSGL